MIIRHAFLLSFPPLILGASDWISLIMDAKWNFLVRLSLVVSATLHRIRKFLFMTPVVTHNLVDSLFRVHPLTLIPRTIMVLVVILPGSAVLVRIDDRK